MSETKWEEKDGMWVASFNGLSAIVFPATKVSKKYTLYVYAVTYTSHEREVLKYIRDNDIHSATELLKVKIAAPILATWDIAYPLDEALRSANHGLNMEYVGTVMHFNNADDMTEEQFNVLKLGGVIGGDYHNWKLLHYEDDKMRCWINTDRKQYLKFREEYEKFKRGETNKITVHAWGEYPPKLKRKYLSKEQIDYLKSFGWKDDEIGMVV